MTNILELRNLKVTKNVGEVSQVLVHDCSFFVKAGESLGLVGESGSGKTLSLRTIAGLLPEGLSAEGQLFSEGVELSSAPPQELKNFRTQKIGMIFQSPRSHINPLRTIGDFMTEALITVAGVPPKAAHLRALELLDEVGIPNPEKRMRQRPSELSGGLLQRVMIAATLAMEPQILLADEITTALDVTTQEEVMAVIGELRKNRNLAMLFVTHDLALAQAVCDRITVMKDGRTIETHRSDLILTEAHDPYTKKLLNAALDIEELSADFSSRDEAPLLTVKNLNKTFEVRKSSGWGKESLVAVKNISFELKAGHSLGIVGESGSGKSTTARVLCGLEKATSGSVFVKGQSWEKPATSVRARRERAGVIQMVFQDPYQSLDPRQTVRQCLTEAIRVQGSTNSDSIEQHIIELMDSVQLSTDLLDRRPRMLSGGQQQRVAIARGLAAQPEILVLDEAVSALDVTTRVEILSLLDRIRREKNLALLMISHDLTVVRRLCDEVIVMKSGLVEEQGNIAQVLDHPAAEYTKLLLESVPRPGWVPRKRRLVQTSAMPTVKRGL